MARQARLCKQMSLRIALSDEAIPSEFERDPSLSLVAQDDHFLVVRTSPSARPRKEMVTFF